MRFFWAGYLRKGPVARVYSQSWRNRTDHFVVENCCFGQLADWRVNPRSTRHRSSFRYRRLSRLDSDPANVFHPRVITSRLLGTNLGFYNLETVSAPVRFPASLAFLWRCRCLGPTRAIFCSCRSPTASARTSCRLRPGYHRHSTKLGILAHST